MNENKKMLIIGIIAIAIVALIPIVSIVTTARSKKIIDNFYEYIDSSDIKLVYIGRDNCSFCNRFEPEIEFIKDEYGIDYLYINTNKLKNKHFYDLLDDLKIDINNFGTPYLVVTKDGKKIAENAGYMSEYKLFEYLQEQKIISKEENLPLNYIDYEEYSKLIESNKNELIVIGQSYCDACLYARPILYEIAEEYGVTINYLNASYIDSQTKDEDGLTDSDKFEESLEFFTTNGISTPTMLVVSNKEVKDSLIGSASKESYVEFLKTYGFIKTTEE